jgi:hypothetical protein
MSAIAPLLSLIEYERGIHKCEQELRKIEFTACLCFATFSFESSSNILQTV